MDVFREVAFEITHDCDYEYVCDEFNTSATINHYTLHLRMNDFESEIDGA